MSRLSKMRTIMEDLSEELKAPAPLFSGILLASVLWAPSAFAFVTWSEDPATDTGYCAECHGNFGQLTAGPQYVSLKYPGSTWSFPTGVDKFTPVSLMDRHSSVLFPDLGLTCDSCHSTLTEGPVLLNASLNGTTCVSCHGSTDLRTIHRDSSKFQTMAFGFPEETKTCAESCHTGGALDTDGDGVPDSVDQCPTQGNQGYGLDADGCPNPPTDRDGDGVMDNDDQCPDQGDAGYGLTADGCPNPATDRDGDGVMDNDDRCPDQGDAGYGLTIDGCPFPAPPADSDGDGIVDPVDQCPTEGDKGYGIDTNGCPNPATDIDGDGVMDNDDACPNEGDQGNGVDATGCPIAASQATTPTASSGGGGGGYISPFFALFMLMSTLWLRRRQ